MNKTVVIYVKFILDAVCRKLLKSANDSRSYSKNNTCTLFETLCRPIYRFQWNVPA